MVISCEGWLVYSQPIRVLVALSGFAVLVVGTVTVRLGIDTLFANILVGHTSTFSWRRQIL